MIYLFQFLFDVEEKQLDVMVSLAQEDQRINKDKGGKNETVGFAIYKVGKIFFVNFLAHY